MSKKDLNRENFIHLYRQKLQSDLDDMGYPGIKQTGAASKPALIIDAGSELARQTENSPSRKRPKAVKP